MATLDKAEVVVIGGGVSAAAEFLLVPIWDRLRRCGPGCPVAGADVVLAGGGDDVGLLGAFALALDGKSYTRLKGEMAIQDIGLTAE